MSNTEPLARAMADAYGWPRHLMPVDHRAAVRILADPGLLLAALAEAGVLRVEKCYTCEGPCERYQYRSEWEPTDA